MKPTPPDRSEVVKELEQRLLKKWKQQPNNNSAPEEKPEPRDKNTKNKKEKRV